jgi:hypothetical protein
MGHATIEEFAADGLFTGSKFIWLNPNSYDMGSIGPAN